MHFVRLHIITFMSLEFIVSKYKVLTIHKYQENWCIAICNLLRLQLELHGCETGVGGLLLAAREWELSSWPSTHASVALLCRQWKHF